MGVVKYIGSKSEQQILALTSSDSKWYDQAFYYPNDVPLKPYYYRVILGEMKKYGGDVSSIGTGITLNDAILGGVKTLIESSEALSIPSNYDYNTYILSVEGQVNCSGNINIM